MSDIIKLFRNSWKLKSWNVKEENIMESVKNIKNTHWSIFAGIIFIETLIYTLLNFPIVKKSFEEIVYDKNSELLLTPEYIQYLSNYSIFDAILTSLVNFSFGILGVIIIYYLINSIFFKSKEFKLDDYYKTSIYPYLNIIFIYLIMYFIVYIGLIFPLFNFFIFLWFILLLYFGFQFLNTYIVLMYKSFDTTAWKFFGALLLVSIIVGIFFYYFIIPSINLYILGIPEIIYK